MVAVAAVVIFRWEESIKHVGVGFLEDVKGVVGLGRSGDVKVYAEGARGTRERRLGSWGLTFFLNATMAKGGRGSAISILSKK